jgi:hypothetical protein
MSTKGESPCWFLGSPAADELLTRPYRKPFVVPASV